MAKVVNQETAELGPIDLKDLDCDFLVSGC